MTAESTPCFHSDPPGAGPPPQGFGSCVDPGRSKRSEDRRCAVFFTRADSRAREALVG